MGNKLFQICKLIKDLLISRPLNDRQENERSHKQMKGKIQSIR